MGRELLVQLMGEGMTQTMSKYSSVWPAILLRGHCRQISIYNISSTLTGLLSRHCHPDSPIHSKQIQ